MTHSQTQGAEGADDAGTEWFWRIVDANGLGNVPSDEGEALRLLCLKASRYDEGQSASSVPPGVRSLLHTARSGLATYGDGAFEGTIAQIDAILAFDPATPAPDATPGVPDSVRALLDAVRPFYACVFNDNGDVSISTGNLTVHHWLALDRAFHAVNDSHPAGQSTGQGDAEGAEMTHGHQPKANGAPHPIPPTGGSGVQRSPVPKLHAKFACNGDPAQTLRREPDSEAKDLFQSERISAALATYDFVLGDADPTEPDHEERVFDAMKAAIQRADYIACTGKREP